jgi:hypothetical protein
MPLSNPELFDSLGKLLAGAATHTANEVCQQFGRAASDTSIHEYGLPRSRERLS